MFNAQYDFEWDPKKAVSNLLKHDISFEESTTIFKDYNLISIYDSEHSESEDRWVSIGLSETSKLLVVSHKIRNIDVITDVVRIFSARKATKTEEKQYKDK